MIELTGKYNMAKVFTDNLDDGAREQIIDILNQDFIEDSDIRIMPDAHKGMGCVIGFTADMGDKVIPNIVGVDIGCGMLTIKLGKMDLDLARLDEIINKHIPSGTKTHHGKFMDFEKLKDLHAYRDLTRVFRMERSIGTLGGGNHFIEVAEDSKKNKWLIIHSGSRNLGKQIADIYQKMAINLCKGDGDYYKKREKIIEDYKARGRKKDIKNALDKLRKEYRKIKPKYPRDLCYLTGEYRDKYLHDMKICQEYASLNRESMANIILSRLLDKDLSDFEHFETIHNYINFKDNIIRKGAISAYEGEMLLIPINMRDGSILGRGKGNPDWNYSAPHGAGRIMSRTEARAKLKLEDFKDTMKGVYSTSVREGTLDEAPFAYKSMNEIINSIGDTVEIIDILKPIYNFKA